MKPAFVSLFIAVLVVLAITKYAQAEDDCPSFCTFEYRPVCGYNGSCYRKYGNACALKLDRCSSAKDVETVEMGLCEEALAKSNPDVISCGDE